MVVTAWLGIDIAKQKFDVALNWKTRRRAKVFRNDAGGWQALLRWLKDLGIDQVHVCLEATGRYGDGLALHLHDAGHRVSVVNPAQIKHFGRVKLGRNKTDRADAALICDYCRLFEPATWAPPSAALRQLRDLVRTREALSASRVDQERRALHEEHRERRQADVRHGVAVARPHALVLKPGTDFLQVRQQFFQLVHGAVESHYHPPGKAPFVAPSQLNAPPAPSRSANATQPH